MRLRDGADAPVPHRGANEETTETFMGTNGKTVLVIDDEPDIVTYLTVLLEEAGYKTVAARDGEGWMTPPHASIIALR